MVEQQKLPEPTLRELLALFLGIGLVMAALVLICLEYTERQELQGEVIVRPAAWATLTIYLICVAAGLVGWWLRRQGEGEGAVPFILVGSVMGAIINFAGDNNHALVNADRFALQTVPIIGNNCDVAFRDLRMVEVPAGTRNLTFTLNNGETQTVSLGGLVRAILPDLRDRLRARGIQHWGLK